MPARFVFQSIGKPSRFSKTVSTPVCREERDGIFGIFVEVSIEYALVHEISIAADVEEDPSQVVKLERGENGRIAGYRRSQLFFRTRGSLVRAPV